MSISSENYAVRIETKTTAISTSEKDKNCLDKNFMYKLSILLSSLVVSSHLYNTIVTLEFLHEYEN